MTSRLTAALLLLALSLLAAACSPSPHAQATHLELDYTRVAAHLSTLSDADRKTVEDTIMLMKRGDHRLALVRLAALNDRTPSNASLRLLASYALLQLGNLAESLAEAQRAHDAADHTAYQCYVLARVAAINGDSNRARREVQHVNGSGDEALKQALAPVAARLPTD
ncbi:MAG: hypothetical protein J0L64_22640 [Acidobacteria bacterium]|nr:hypothetical protein [Acidobacteriota bacterium]